MKERIERGDRFHDFCENQVGRLLALCITRVAGKESGFALFSWSTFKYHGSDHPDSIRPAKFPGIFSAVGLQYRRMSRYIEVHDFISEPLSSVRELALFLFFAGGRGGRPGGLVRFSCSTRQPCAGMLLLDDVGEERGRGGERRVCATHIKRVCFCGGSGGGTKSDTYHPQRTNIMA